jgi:hypothetical protein
MKEKDQNKQGKSSRRNFLKNIGAGVGAVSLSGIAHGVRRLSFYHRMAGLLRLIRMI